MKEKTLLIPEKINYLNEINTNNKRIKGIRNVKYLLLIT